MRFGDNLIRHKVIRVKYVCRLKVGKKLRGSFKMEDNVCFNKISRNNPIVVDMLSSWCLARKDQQNENSTSEVEDSRAGEVPFLWNFSLGFLRGSPSFMN